MKNTRVRKPTTGVSLFSFLDVLICMMGEMIVLLFLVHQARVEADVVVREKAASAVSSASEAAEIDTENYQWRRQVLQQQRTELTQQLAEQRLELGHLEDHIRRLQDQWRRLVSQAEQLQRGGPTQPQEREQIEAQKARLREAIEAAKRDLAQAQSKLASKPRSYAIIPYDGPNGTFRRPIYIECRGDAIVFQPEGITLGPKDFDGPLGPGNPFDAALRATREYLASAGTKGGEPYPLLVVRPDGAVAYALARSAMKSWDDEYGYELVDQEMELAYPPADEHLAATLERALKDARRRQELLAQRAPSKFRSRRGGGAGGNPSGSGNGHGDGSVQGEGFIDRFGGRAGREPAGSMTGGLGSGGASENGGKAPGAGTPGGGRSFSEPGSESGEPTGGVFYGSKPPGKKGQAAADAASVGFAGPTDAGSFANGNSAGGSSDSASDAPSGASLSLTKDASKQSPSTTPPRRRTPNSGLPNSSQAAVGYTRPIRIACSAERLVILPERGEDAAPRVVPFSANAPAPIDDFVQEVWKHMESWGIAGQRAYWKPVLSVQVAPGGEERFAELESQLRGSGLDVKRK